jgi:cyclopropane-fatty-acyl-phospholipid synthase
LPSIAQVAAAVELKLVIEDLENLGPDYDRTLMAWHSNFQRAKPALRRSRLFERMWDFYLLYSASGFRARKTQLWQFMLSKGRNARYDRRLD